MVKTVNDIDILEQEKITSTMNRVGTKKELYHYLEREVGSEIEISWRTSIFYVSF